MLAFGAEHRLAGLHGEAVFPPRSTARKVQFMTERYQFPDGFLWGSATSAYQIEGSPLADGAGPSIWQRFAHTPGMTSNGDTGDIACDHYQRYRDDVALMHRSASRPIASASPGRACFREGTGRINQAGLDFYDRLVDALLEKGIEPLATLYHWDLPAALDDRGGWLNPDIADWFADYGEVMFRKLDGRVKTWVTLNEPWVVTDGGYLHGALAPGHRSLYETPIASRNLMRAHGAAVQRYRAVGAHEIGLVVNLEPKYPASGSDADLAATARSAAYMNRQYLDPAYGLGCPAEMKEIFGEAWQEWSEADLALAAQPTDWLGVNYYTRGVMKGDAARWPVGAAHVRQPDKIYTETGWEAVRAGADRHALVGEGALRQSARLHHRERRRLLRSAERKRRPGARSAARATISTAICAPSMKRSRRAPTFAATWPGRCSTISNGRLGYSKRFGIVHVDFATQERTPKDSARFYAKVVASNGGALNEGPWKD